MKLLLFAHFPESYFKEFRISYNKEVAQAAIDRGAFTTVEGIFIKKLLNYQKLNIKIISYSRAITHSQSKQIADNCTLEIYKPAPLSGMPVGWLPRIIHAKSRAKDFGPDIVHGIRTLEGYGTMAAECSGLAPTVITVHEILKGIPCPIHLRPAFAIAARLAKNSLRKTDQVISISRHVTKSFPASIQPKCVDIPNSISKVFFSVEKETPTNLLFVGRISEEKGLMEALKAVCYCREHGVEIPFRVIGGASGDGADAFFSECQEFAKARLAPGQVEFLGWRSSEEIAIEHKNAKFLIMPSRAAYETFGLVITEAMASGTPVITYDASPMNELVQDEVNGWLSDPNKPAHLGEVLQRAWVDGNSWTRLSSNAQKYAEQFKIETVVAKHLDLYTKLTNRSKHLQL